MESTPIDVHEFREFMEDVTETLVKERYHEVMPLSEWRVELLRELARRKGMTNARSANDPPPPDLDIPPDGPEKDPQF